MKLHSCKRSIPFVALVAGLGGLFTVVNLTCAQPWATTDAPALSWKALASSADGTRLVAAANARFIGAGPLAPIYVSTNAGATWTQTTAPSNNWSSVACSADGLKLVAVARPYYPGNPDFGVGLIYTSPDAGATWMPTSAPSNNWYGVASSADGTKLVAVSAPGWGWVGTNWSQVGGEGAIYRSADAGATWTCTTAPSNIWASVASSADGTKLVAVAGLRTRTSGYIGEGAIYRSLDSGATWTRASAPNVNWSSVASSADGTKCVAAAGITDAVSFSGLIYTSTDSGATWTATTAPSNYWSCVASSADGTKLVAADGSDGPPGLIYISTNSGTTWTATRAPGAQWAAVACSADGYRLTAGGYYTSLCRLPYSGPWTLADAPAQSWCCVASSADGSTIVAGAGPALPTDYLIYTSSNSGTVWIPTSSPTNYWWYWSAVASSADGAKLVAVSKGHYDLNLQRFVDDGPIFVSTNSGATWTATSAPGNYWVSVASSADGTKLVALAERAICCSSDSGATWAQASAPYVIWSSVASSADGAKLVAAEGSLAGLIYTSPDSGTTWTRTSAPSNRWSCIASSADGSKLVAGAGSYGDGLIYTSSNSGGTWVSTAAPSHGWASVSSSADGRKLVALGAGDLFRDSENQSIYISTDSGATWARSDSPAVNEWGGVASSADGSHIVAVSREAIYLLESPAPVPPLPPSPRLVVERPDANLDLSWLVPSTRFGLERSSDLRSATWVDVPDVPVLDCTNLHYRVRLTPSPGSCFYRLKQQ